MTKYTKNNINTVISGSEMQVNVVSSALPSDAATQTTLALIKAKTDNIPALGQALAAASVPVVQPAIIKTITQVQDWTSAAQNTVVESSIYDCSTKKNILLYIQAALDTTTAHSGTRFIIQISSNSDGDEDWQDLTQLIGLVGTAATDLIENNPLAAGSTSITLTAHALTALAKWLLIEDSTLANSELVFEVAQSANAITILDGTKNAHAVNTAIFNVAMTQIINIPDGAYRIRVLVDNTYDNDGSTLNFRIAASGE